MVPLNMFKPSSDVMLTVFFLLLLYQVYLSDVVLSVPCTPVVTCWEWADDLALLFIFFFLYFCQFSL